MIAFRSLRYFAVACTAFAWTGLTLASLKPILPRKHVSLDGTWHIAQGGMDTVPEAFAHTVPVPGLVDLAEPRFEGVGKKSPLRQAFWYRRRFKLDGAIPDVAILKLHKAKYASKIWLNGKVVAEHSPCFTPAYFDVKSLLRGGGDSNEIMIRVGADRESLPQDTATGWDFEKYLYIPGIYDSVELILTGKPYIRNVQVVPDIKAGQIQLVAEIEGGDAAVPISAEVTAEGDRAVVGKAQTMAGGEVAKVNMTVTIPDCRLWSPEDPFLYQVTLRTPQDAAKVRFGMRSFGFDPETRRALLNGKPYCLRGSNITLLRFFEDSARGDLPWRADWVRKLHQRCKGMHWNSLRYCIGFPPEFWYDIADEEGILIQDEFPIWLLNNRDKCPEFPLAKNIIPQYTAWMRERWNHPCVVIWDAQNESITPETGKALQAVRELDLSNRPWENGWAEPQADTDCVESHPYLFIRDWNSDQRFKISDLARHDGFPRLQESQRKKDVAIVINEYAWLWLTRDGNPTCLTDKIYEHQLGPQSTVEQRRKLYARYLAALTEFWRAKRRCAGVLHFCTLGYSRSGDLPRPEGGATSDHWKDVEALAFEPHFESYVRDAFAPVGIMLDFWDKEVTASEQRQVKIVVTNDLEKGWKGKVRLKLVCEGQPISANDKSVEVEAYGQAVVEFGLSFPAEPGACELIAQRVNETGEVVTSHREFVVQVTSEP